jgi:hypothetical protein
MEKKDIYFWENIEVRIVKLYLAFNKVKISASDNIRAIWAYTMALLQTSNEYAGNHPGLLIFDEPAQHSIGAYDTKAFFDSIIKLGNNCQVIIGIAINNADSN